MIDSRRHSVQKQLVLINELNQVAWMAGFTIEVGLVWGSDLTALVRFCFISECAGPKQFYGSGTQFLPNQLRHKERKKFKKLALNPHPFVEVIYSPT